MFFSNTLTLFILLLILAAGFLDYINAWHQLTSLEIEGIDDYLRPVHDNRPFKLVTLQNDLEAMLIENRRNLLGAMALTI